MNESPPAPARPRARSPYVLRLTVGIVLILVGIPMLVCPGPGLVTIGIGLALIGIRRPRKPQQP